MVGCLQTALVLLLLNLATINSEKPTAKHQNDVGGSLRTAFELIKLRGFKPEQHYVKTKDGYILSLVKLINPAIKKSIKSLAHKDAILFVHGIIENSNSFLINSEGAHPIDRSHINAANMTLDQLKMLLSEDKNSDSFVFTACNFGHEIWLLDRRPTFASSSSILKSRNPKQDKKNIILFSEKLDQLPWLVAETKKYYNFTFDQQAEYDIPQTIDYILSNTHRKRLSYVGHSMGGALILMALSQRTELAKKVHKLMLWAPATNMGGKFKWEFLGPLIKALIKKPLPLPPSFILPIERDLLTGICETEMSKKTICNFASDMFFGPHAGSQNLKMPFADAVDISSTMELGHLIQWFKLGTTHFFDYQDKQKNLIAYSQPKPPAYDFSKIKLPIESCLSIWWGAQDTLVRPDAVESTIKSLKVPIEKHYMDLEDTSFNHLSFLIHKNVSSLIVLPALKAIESAC